MLKEIAGNLLKEELRDIAVDRSNSKEMSDPPENTLVQTAVVTFFVAFGYKILHGMIKQHFFKASVVVVGAGPIGLISVLVASQIRCTSRLLLIEETSYYNLVSRNHQIAIQADNVKFLRNLGINFKNIEGIWQGDTFVTLLGTFEEYLLELIYRLNSKVKVEIRLCTKVSYFILYLTVIFFTFRGHLFCQIDESLIQKLL